jgi:hypothetical protein
VSISRTPGKSVHPTVTPGVTCIMVSCDLAMSAVLRACANATSLAAEKSDGCRMLSMIGTLSSGDARIVLSRRLTTPRQHSPRTERWATSCISYSQNIQTCLSTGSYASISARTSACLPPHHHRYSSPTLAMLRGRGNGLETPAGIYHRNRRLGTAAAQ